jgi:hypothetical protein
MSGFRMWCAAVCLGAASAAWAVQPAEDSTHFFKTHSNVIDLKEQGDAILLAKRQG